MTTATAQSFDAAERRQYIGASEIAAVMGLDRWRTPLDVFQEKTGLVEPFTGNKHTERGNRLEAIAAELFTELTGQKLQRRNQAYTHPAHPFIVGHIDRVFVGEKKLAEIKCPSIAAYRKYQREGLPESMVIQMQMYLGLTGYKSGVWIVFCADAWDLATFEIEFDHAIYSAAVNAAFEFWTRNVATGTAPEIDAKTDVAIEASGSVTFRDDEAFIAKSAALREAIELERDAAELKEIAKKEFIECIEDAPGIYECPGLRVHYNLRPGRKSLDKKAMAADGIDISKYEKTGSSFKEFRPYLLSNSGE